jgi:hypothetical protein
MLKVAMRMAQISLRASLKTSSAPLQERCGD